MKINIAYDRLGEYNLSHTDLKDRFKTAPKWIEHACDEVVENTVDYFIQRQQKFIYCLGTVGGPKWWLRHIDDTDDNLLFNNLSVSLIKHAQQGLCWIHLDQSLEGFPLKEVKTSYHKPRVVDFYKILHDNFKQFKISPKQLIYSTSNLIEEHQYNRWCEENSVTEKFHIVSAPFFACATQQRGFFDWTDKPDLRDEPHDVKYQAQLNYKSTHAISLFNCLNRVQRTHRATFVAMLNYYNLVTNNIVSHDILEPHYKQSLKVNYWQEHPAFEEPNFSRFKNKLPLTYDMDDFSVNHAQNFNQEIYLKTWVSVVSETLYEDWQPTVFFSEKIFKPIRAHHPFILVCHPGAIAWLKKLGFQTFSNWWDESYDQEPDPVKRMQMICEVLLEIKKINTFDWFNTYQSMEKVLRHNYTNLLSTNWFQQSYQDVLKKTYGKI